MQNMIPQKTLKRLLPLPLIPFTIALSLSGPICAQTETAFTPKIKVNDLAITSHEIEQRALLLEFFETPGNSMELAREQLIEDRLKIDAANNVGFALDQDELLFAMDELANRNGFTTEELIRAMSSAGIHESTYREFVRAGHTWRELVRARFSSRVTVSEGDMERARIAISQSDGVRVLLSEIFIPAPRSEAQKIQEFADRLSSIKSFSAFESAARRFSAANSRDAGGRLDWLPIADLPPQFQAAILGLTPGEVTDPLHYNEAFVLFQLRDIEETGDPGRKYAFIEYAEFNIPGGRGEEALAQINRVKVETDTCDDLYGLAKDMPEDALNVTSLPPNEIPSDIARELEYLDPGEISAKLTRNSGQTLLLLMLCSRTPLIEGEGPAPDQLSNYIGNLQLDSFSQGYLEQLRAEARIIERE